MNTEATISYYTAKGWHCATLPASESCGIVFTHDDDRKIMVTDSNGVIEMEAQFSGSPIGQVIFDAAVAQAIEITA